MMNEIMVSINCITYNHEKYIRKAIDSFLMQNTNFLYEILIHDDASTDSTADIIREYQNKYPEIVKPILQKENQLSQGVKHINYQFNQTRSIGKYVAICEGDDYWTDPNKLQKQVDYMESNPDCTLCMHAVGKIDAQTDKNLGVLRPKKKNAKCQTDEVIKGGGGFVGTNSLLFPKEIFDRPPKWYFDAPVGDYPMQIYLVSKGYAYYIDEVMSIYRIGVKDSWTSRTVVSVEKTVEHYEKIANMLNDINESTEYIYESAINSTIKINRFNIMLLQEKYYEVKEEEFKEIYSKLNVIVKIKLFIKHYFPGVSNTYKNIKRGIMNG